MENLENNNQETNNTQPENAEAGGQEKGGNTKAQEYFKNRKQKFFNRRNKEHREGGEESSPPQRGNGQRGEYRQYNNQPNRNDNSNEAFQESGNGWHTNIKNAIEANKRMHQARLSTDGKLNTSTRSTIRITPLGGLEEIGGNITVIETQNSAILVDVGMSFPDDDMHGVDILIPDFTYLKSIKHKIAGIVITHAHEDHIGAVPYLFREMQFPLYGTPLPLGMIGNKFDEHKMSEYKKYFRAVEKRKIIKIGEFEVEWLHMTHSVIDASSLAITTEAGTIIHTGDFKIDHTPIDGYPADLHRLAYYGEKGVLCLLSDSTNSMRSGTTLSESSVGPTFDTIFSRSKGRVIMSTFSSNIHRVYQAIDMGLKYNRKVAIIGRSMERNLEVAMNLGYIKLPFGIFIDAAEVAKYPDNEVLIVTTGSQGETMSALYRMATNEHRHIKLKPSDTVILSSSAIPGNEGSVSTVLNYILKSGSTVAYKDFSDIHVSGHGAQEEQKLMLRLVKPKFFLPIHGEYQHVAKHKETAIACGVEERNILLMEDGDQIELNARGMRKIKTVKSGKVYIDNQRNNQIEEDVVMDRQELAENGIVMIVAFVDKQNRVLLEKPKVSSFGLVSDRDDRNFSEEMENVLVSFLQNANKEAIENKRMLENEIRQVLKKHIFRALKKYPVIVPTIFVQ
ncbi:MAG: ribonuclease J [Campylobacterales bacterium]|nr:ribonuclease J [Campylobacterales bacterium]